MKLGLMKLHIKNKPTTYLISVIIFFIALEIFMRFVGIALMQEQASSNNKKLAQAKDKIRILCLGESTTAAAFFAKGLDNSWPSLLEKKLNSAGLGKEFVVFNRNHNFYKNQNYQSRR